MVMNNLLDYDEKCDSQDFPGIRTGLQPRSFLCSHDWLQPIFRRFRVFLPNLGNPDGTRTDVRSPFAFRGDFVLDPILADCPISKIYRNFLYFGRAELGMDGRRCVIDDQP